MSSSLRQIPHNKDKENEVYHTKNIPRTPKQQQHIHLKKQFKTPPLNASTRIPLGGKQQDDKNQISIPINHDKLNDHSTKIRPSSKLARRTTPLKRKVNILNEVASKQQQQQPAANSFLAKLNKLNDFKDSDLKLDEFLKHEKGDDIDIEIVPTKLEPLADEPDDSISFKDINLAKIYKSPFHVPEFVENDKHLEQALHVEFNDDDDDFLSWDFDKENNSIKSNSDDDQSSHKSIVRKPSISKKTPITVLKTMKSMDINSASPINKNSSKKRFMSSTTASANKKTSTTPIMTSRKLSHEAFNDGYNITKNKNLLSELVKNENNDNDDDEEELNFDDTDLKVEDEELRSLF